MMNKTFLFAALLIMTTTATAQDSTKDKTANVRNQICELMKTFWLSESVDERAKFVINAERVRPLMEKYYAKNGIETLDYNCQYIRMKKMNDSVYVDEHTAYILTADGLKMDWESLVEYNEKTFEQMKRFPKKEFLVRAILLNLDTSYQNDTWGKITLSLNRVHSVYYRKDAPFAERLEELATEESLNVRYVTVKVMYEPEDENDYYNYVLTDFLKEGYSLYQ